MDTPQASPATGSRIPGRYVLAEWILASAPTPWVSLALFALLVVFAPGPEWLAVTLAPLILLLVAHNVRKARFVRAARELVDAFDGAAAAAGTLPSRAVVAEALAGAGVVHAPRGERLAVVRKHVTTLLDSPDCSGGHSQLCGHRIDADSRAFWRALVNASA
jgi:hypothetical protein